MAITRFEDLPSENSPINSENLNGNFDELGVKVGTSVDNNYRTNIIKGLNGNASIVVDGETIYTKGQNEEYSTFEQRIGTWIDGKPLYRKVVSATFGTVTEGTQSEITITMNNVGFALIDKYWLDRMNENYPAINQGYASDAIYLGYTSFSDSNCYLKFRTKVAFASSKKVYAIVEYTKTTDA